MSVDDFVEHDDLTFICRNGSNVERMAELAGGEDEGEGTSQVQDENVAKLTRRMREARDDKDMVLWAKLNARLVELQS